LEEKFNRSMFEWADGGFGDWRDYGLGNVVRDEFNDGVPAGSPIVNVFPFGGQILASGEQCLPPVALDPLTLDTIGIVPWSTKLAQGMSDPACFGDAAFTAHPKWDERTGTMYGWSYRDVEPFVTLHWVTTDGRVQSRELWDAPYAQNAHDCWLTEKYMVMAFQPFTVSLERISKQLAVFGWEPDKPTVLALIPRNDINGDIRWITADFEPQYIMHTMSANHHGEKLVLDGPIFERPPFPFEDEVEFGVDFIPFGSGVMGRWVVDLESGTVTSERLDDTSVEFPKVDERFYGQPYTWGFLAQGESLWSLDTVVRRNVHTGAEDKYTIDSEDCPVLFEPTFAPRSGGTEEGDGYLLVPVSRFSENLSEYQIFDTRGISDGPVARIELPFQIGWTPHGHWMDFA
jgi:carotenoid cleavage dioxygenase-like enzyme